MTYRPTLHGIGCPPVWGRCMLPALRPSASIPFHGPPFSTGKQGLTGVLTAVWTVVAIKQMLAFVAVLVMDSLCLNAGKRLIPSMPAEVHDALLRIDLNPVTNRHGFCISSQVAR